MNANIKRFSSSYTDEHNDISFQNMLVPDNTNSGSVDHGVSWDDDTSVSSICTLDDNNSFSLLDRQELDYKKHSGHFNSTSKVERPCNKRGAIIAASLNANDHTDDCIRHLLQSFIIDLSEMLQHDKEGTCQEGCDDDADADSSICQDSIKVTIRRRSKMKERSRQHATNM
jgi:hypothetical protein